MLEVNKCVGFKWMENFAAAARDVLIMCLSGTWA